MGSRTIKGAEEIKALCKRRYARVWADEALSLGSTGWPYTLRVGKPSQRDLEQGYAQISSEAESVIAWARSQGLLYKTEPRRVGRMTYPVLSHVLVPNMEILAHAAGETAHWARFCERAVRLRSLFPEIENANLRYVLVSLNRADASDADFELVCTAALWFGSHEVHDLTPREVPLEGFHAKWLDTAGHRQTVCALAGLDSLVLKERPRMVCFTYLDPMYRSTGARMHDSWLEGDAILPAYEPELVVICENRDSALWFPSLKGAISVQGDGMAGVPTLAQIDWIAHAPQVLYWGDIDIHGFRILSAYREHGLKAKSILMDQATYRTYERFGTSTDRHGRPLPSDANASALAGLTDGENALYLELCSPGHRGPRRIEQERIPLAVALDACQTAISQR